MLAQRTEKSSRQRIFVYLVEFNEILNSTSLMRVDRFTLSFPFQIKLKRILFASTIMSLCIQTKPALYIRIGTANVFTI